MLVIRHIAATLLIVLSAAGFASAQAAPPPAAYFARAAAIEGVRISPDGKHILAITSPDGVNKTISVWKTDALDQPPTVIAPLARMWYLYADFIKNDRIGVFAEQTFTYSTYKGHLTNLFITDLEGKKWLQASVPGKDPRTIEGYAQIQILNPLPLDPQNVILLDNTYDGQGDVLKFNIYTGQSVRLDRASSKTFEPQVDLKGELRAKKIGDFANGDFYIAQMVKNPATGKMEEIARTFAKNRETTEIAAFSNDPNLIYLHANNGRDKSGLYLYDLTQKKIIEPAFEHKFFNAVDVVQSHSRADLGEVLGFVYQADQTKTYWVDPQMAAMDKGLNAALGIAPAPVQWTDPGTGETGKIATTGAASAQIVDWSDDRKTVIVEKSGPKQPAEYYLLEDGKLTLLGKSREWIDTTTLGDTKLVEYRARDGLMIPAFLTTPPASFGAGPHPTLIVPHGGPWARDEIGWDFSGWTQYFASRGYVVLQPQFRGSEGWGNKLWRAGDAEWGQKMQDDKDDGAKWLIEQKLAAPDRIAMFGYSYGGYAALAAAIRPNGLYQCTISGAGAGDLHEIQNETYDNRILRDFQNSTIKGLDALAHAKEAKIPVFIYHGDRDQIVDVKQSREFASALKSAGLPHRYLEIKDMGHTFDTWTAAMAETQLVEVEKFLNTECGPGGI